MVTLINVSNVAPEDQQRLVGVLVDATQRVMRYQQGFISANIHRILDGTRVTNYAQWQSREAIEGHWQLVLCAFSFCWLAHAELSELGAPPRIVLEEDTEVVPTASTTTKGVRGWL